MKRSLAIALLLTGSIVSASCGGGGGSAGPPGGGLVPPPHTPTPSPTSSTSTGVLTITAVDNSSPTAMTAVHISTKGLNTSAPVTVIFSNNNGFTASVSPIRVAGDGTVTAAVPLYIDQSTNKTAPATFSLTLSQGGNVSGAVTLNVQDIPQLSDFGTSLGEITRTFYNYETMSLGQHLGSLQALQASRVDAIDTSTEQGDVKSLLTNTILARNDVDRIMSNNALVLQIGTTQNGTAVTFDSTSLALQDRILGWYLVNIADIVGHGNGPLSAYIAKRVTFRNGRRIEQLNVSAIKAILSGLSTSLGTYNAGKDYITALGSQPNAASKLIDQTLALGSATFGIIAALPVAPAVATTALVVGMGFATASIWNHVFHEVCDMNLIENQATNGASAAQVAAAQQDLAAQPTAALLDGFGVFVNWAQYGAAGAQIFNVVENESVSSLGIEGAGLFKEVASLATSNEADADKQTSDNGAQQISQDFTTASPELFQQAGGVVDVSNSNQGTVFAGLSGVELGDSTIDASTVADPNGNYSFFVPIDNSTIDYSNMTLAAYDPVTDTTTGAIAVNLDNLGVGGTTEIPLTPFSATCNDTDASAPDNDDPDCD
jgi:hypothetical protein